MDCPYCEHDNWLSRTNENGTRVECAQCGICLTGWCATRAEALALQRERVPDRTALELRSEAAS